MSIDIDIDKIAEDLNDKADLDMDNTVGHLGTAAKEYFSAVGMPSSRYVDLALGASGDLYTAPANGWVFVGWSGTANGNGSSLDIQSPIAMETYSNDSDWQRHCLPIQKGITFRVYYSGTRTLSRFRFYYAEGVK